MLAATGLVPEVSRAQSDGRTIMDVLFDVEASYPNDKAPAITSFWFGLPPDLWHRDGTLDTEPSGTLTVNASIAPYPGADDVHPSVTFSMIPYRGVAGISDIVEAHLSTNSTVWTLPTGSAGRDDWMLSAKYSRYDRNTAPTTMADLQRVFVHLAAVWNPV